MSQASNASSFVLNFINSKPKHNDSASRKGLKNPKPQLRMLSSSDSSSDENDENKSSQKIRLALESGSEDDNEMHNSSNGVIQRHNFSNHSSFCTEKYVKPTPEKSVLKTPLPSNTSATRMNSSASSLNTTAVSKVSANISGNRTASSTTPTMLASVARLTPHSNTSGLRVNGFPVSFPNGSTYGTYSGVGNPEMQKKGVNNNLPRPPAFPTTWKEQTPATSKSNLQKSRSLSHSVIHKPRKTQSTGSSGHRRLSRGSSEEPCSPGKKRKIAKAKLVKNEDDPRIQRLKKYINAAGLRPKYEELLQNSSSDDHIVKLLEEYLVKKGIQKPFGMDKCLQYKADQDFKREVMSLEILNPTLKSQVKSLINSASETRVLRKVVTLDSTSEEDEDEEEESDSEDEGPRGPKQVFASLADIVSSEGSEGDSD
uniref:Uncharacterized protein n=1 Tax=Ditylenchus dipsaci TaxID=166011 RepID=A0A915DXD7_9BILA